MFTEIDHSLQWQHENETIRLIPWGPNSIRVVSRPNGPLDLSCAALLPQTTTGAVLITPDQARLTVGELTAVIDRQTQRLQFVDATGHELLAEADSFGPQGKKARQFVPRSGDDYQLTARFTSAPTEKLYGMGQYQQTQFDLKGSTLELAQRNTQASVPFYLSDQGYGFFWHNPAVGSVFFGTNETVWQAAATTQLDYWVTAGHTPAQLITQYTEVVGRAPEMPAYGLGFWQSKLRYHTQEEVLTVAREYHRRKLPLAVLVVDYYHWPYCGDYRFDTDAFPDPAAMTAELARYGIKLMVSVWPQIDTRSENYRTMRDDGLLVQTTQGLPAQTDFHGNNVFFDALNPQARQFVWAKLQQNYGANGVHLFWLDAAEPEFSRYDFGLYRYYTGPALAQSNRYPLALIQTISDGETASGQEQSVKLVRSAWAGSQRYGALVWSGDVASTWAALRTQLVIGLQMGIAGIPWWTTDIGGFHGGKTADPAFQELLVRWFEFGTFSPVMRLHGDRSPHTAVYKASGERTEGTGAGNEPWSFGTTNEAILTKFIRLREKLRPYLTTVMHEAHETGLPALRALFLEFPADERTWQIKDSYLLGADILVAPVTKAGQTTWPVYLPTGAEWVDARDGKWYAGGQTVTVAAALDTLPVFLRNGEPHDLIGQL